MSGTRGHIQADAVLRHGTFRTVLFAYAWPCVHELAAYRKGEVPSHRLWGFTELQELGYDSQLCAEPPRKVRRFGSLGWRAWQTLWMLRSGRKAAAIIAVHEITAAFLLAARWAGVPGPPIIVLNLAILHPKNLSGLRRKFWTLLLKKAAVTVSLVEHHSEGLRAFFGVPRRRTRFLPMGVDAAFFPAVDPATEEPFCLAVGTNDGKDFETLLEALPLEMRLVVVTDSYNAAKVRAHRCFGTGVEVLEAVPAVRLRALYQKAAVVVIPLADTPHGSGHTVLLENLALGKIVIVSESRNMKDYVAPGRIVVRVPVGDVGSLREALLEAMEHPERFEAQRREAAACARERFAASRWGQGLAEILTEVSSVKQNTGGN